MKNHKGFGVVAIFLTILVVSVVCITGWSVYSHNKKTPPQNNTESQSIQPPTSTESEANKEVASTGKAENGYITIPEWGIKIKMQDADKITFSIVPYREKVAPEFLGFIPEATAVPTFKSEYLQDKTCEPGLAMYRYKDYVKDVNSAKVGNYYYYVTGAPGACTADGQGQDEILKGQFLKDFVVQNIVQL